MKRKIYLGIAAIILLLILIPVCVFASKSINDDYDDLISTAKKAGENKTVIAVVDGIEIYQETIDFYAKGEEIAMKNTAQNITEQSGSDTVDTNSILQKQIRDAVVLAEAKRQGLEVGEKEAREYTIENYEIVKELGGETYQTLSNYMSEMEWTEEEYIEKLILVNQNKLTRAQLYEKFAEGKTGSYNDIVSEYEKYVDDLIKKANIEYK